ncbi:MAG: T9SS type A sorting domain-containing protein [Bacteroidales bacterium]
MIKPFFLLTTLIIFCVLPASSQEILQSLVQNPEKSQSSHKSSPKDAVSTPLTLPFHEDFSHKGPYPDHRLWADSFVFVNSSFARFPVTNGTATFDALNQRGAIYEQASETPFQFTADFLTSQPIRLDSVFSPAPMALTPADSIILTFYFQPQGMGSAPRQRDSLALEFLHTPGYYMPDPENEGEDLWVEDLWIRVWSTTGTTLNEFYQANNNQWFKRIAIAVEDVEYFRPDFRFRFRNYASFPIAKTPSNFAGNTSIWNIDYISLDFGRSSADPYYYDIAFAAPAQSILRNYQAMPWKQYIANPQQSLRVRFDNTITNLNNVTHNYFYGYFIQDETGTTIRNYVGNFWNIAPFSTSGYQNYAPHTNPLVLANPFPVAPAKARQFTITHFIREGQTGDDNRRNDTIRFRQIFDNYYAYDDGTPESGYGLVGNQARGAVRFILNQPDTLTAVRFFFNPTLGNQNQRNFILTIWKDLDPEIILYESAVVSTTFPEGINTFAEYPLDFPLIVSDTLYVGWRQITNDFLNIGFDASNNAGAHIFYNTSGEWLPTIFQGALMIRPVFGEAFFTSTPALQPQQFSIYPNPVRGNTLQVQPDIHQQYPGANLSVFDATGRLLGTFPLQDQNDISALPNGMYLIRISDAAGNSLQTTKLIIAR